ncbi:hypothetical protein EGW08_002811 [Elysia chlorotica]|uniref:Uncharacterized protein n=1 Tax=Elysia chlorotica TaxID=188477 RepID=A0A433U6X7_ELYCH|nr:hypothetical protein EGW08_002811 [Elysia chlorotica]
MAKSSFVSKAGGLLRFCLSLIYRLTVKLTVEFLKIGILLAILIGAAVVSVFAFVYCIIWVYITSGGSILVSSCACVIACFLSVAILWVLQVLVKDVLCLTDLTLPELAKLFASAAFKKRKCGKEKGVNANAHGDVRSPVPHDETVSVATRRQSSRLKKDRKLTWLDES